MTTILGPLPCISCGRIVYWERIGAGLWLMETTETEARRHGCRPRCRARMPRGERCDRLEGHSHEHRSRRVLDNAAARRRARYERIAA